MASKHVQTELPEDVYGALRQAAEAQGKPLKTLIRDAIEAYLEADLEADPLMELVGAGNLPEESWSERDDWRNPHR